MGRSGERVFCANFPIRTFNHPYLFQTVFSLNSPIHIPETIMDRTVYQYEYPIQVTVELCGSAAAKDVAFDVLLVYDERE